MRSRLAFFIGLPWLALLTLPGWADYLDGLHAYERHDFATALRVWRPLAEAGDPEAQHRLGEMYLLGRGVDTSDREAVQWFGRSAESGYALAQYELGMMYLDGRQVPQDDVQAVMWLTLAAAQGHQLAVAFLTMSQDLVRPEDWDAGKQMASGWSHGP